MTKIQKLLKDRGMTTHRFHKEFIGGHRATVYRVVNGTLKGTGPLRAKIAEALNVAEGEIYDDAGMARRKDDRRL